MNKMCALAAVGAICGLAAAQPLCPSEWRPEGPGPEFDAVVWGAGVVPGSGGTPDRLYVGGEFVSVDGSNIRAVAQLGPSGWEAVGQSPLEKVEFAAAFDFDGAGPGPTCFVIGRRTSNVMHRWNGSEWSAVPGTLGLTAVGVTPVQLNGQQRLVAFGNRTGVNVGAVTIWDGDHWSLLPDVPGSTRVYSATTFDFDGDGPQPPRLVAGTSSNTVRVYNGTSWESVGGTLPLGGNTIVATLLAYDPDGPGPAPRLLHAGSGGGVARWTGAAWERIGATTEGTVNCALSFDPDGCGPADPILAVGGFFTHIGGVYSPHVIGWDGAHWFPIGTPNVIQFRAGVSLSTIHGTPQREGTQLVMTGYATGNPLFGRVLFYGCEPTPGCPADFNSDGFVDCFDYFDFIACFEGETCPEGRTADFNGDGFPDFLDVGAFIEAFEGGCEPGLLGGPECP